MLPVDRPVHCHGGLEAAQPTVDPDAVGKGGQCGGTEAGGARGHGVADPAHHAGVHLATLQTQLAQDVLSVLQTTVRPGDRRHTKSRTVNDLKAPLDLKGWCITV